MQEEPTDGLIFVVDGTDKSLISGNVELFSYVQQLGCLKDKPVAAAIMKSEGES